MTKSSATEIWADDKLGRENEAAFLKRFLIERTKERKAANRSGSYVLNVDAEWGRGKSFFLERFARTLEAEKFLVAKVNAWRDDYADDPLIAVMAAIDAAVAPNLSVPQGKLWRSIKSKSMAVAVAGAKGAAQHWAEKLVGDGLTAAFDAAGVDGNEKITEAAQEQIDNLLDKTATGLLKNFTDTQASIESFRRNLAKFLKSVATSEKAVKPPLFVVVDELDRCRPTYAIAFLERVKHLFEVDDVIFVIATDTDQLTHSIRAVYGAEFGAQRYLFRFFDRTYQFESPSQADLVQNMLKTRPLDPAKVSLPPDISIEAYLGSGFDFFNLPPRDCEQIYDMLRATFTSWDNSFPIELSAIFPLIVAHQQQIQAETNIEKGLAEIRVKNKGKSSWIMKMPLTVKHDEKPFDGIKFSSRFRTLAAEPFANILSGEMRPANGAESWMFQRLGDEYRFLSQHGARGNFRSMINGYEQLVRTAGRLVPAAARQGSS